MDSNILLNYILSSFKDIYLLDIVNDKVYGYSIIDNKLNLDFNSNFLAFVDSRKKCIHPDDFNDYFESISIKKLTSSINNGFDDIIYTCRIKNENSLYKDYTNIIRLIDNNGNKLVLILCLNSKNILNNKNVASDDVTQNKLNNMVDTVSDVIMKIYNSINISSIDSDNTRNTYVYNYIVTLLNELNSKFPEFNKQYEHNLISQVNRINNKILIIDDDSMTRSLLTKAFANDFEVITATNGKEAIEVLEYSNDKINSIDDINAIFLDIAMPVLDGFGVLNYLRTNNLLRKIPVIIISAAEDKTIRDKIYKYNVADMLEKPFNIEIIKYRSKNFINLYKTSNSLNQLILGKNMQLINTIDVLSKSSNTNILKYIEMLYNQVLDDNKVINLSTRNFKSTMPLHVEISILIVEYIELLNKDYSKDDILKLISKKENIDYSSTVIDSFKKIVDKF